MLDIRQNCYLLFGTLFLLILVVALIALGMGEHWINPLSPAGDMESRILWELRWPRLLPAFAVGGMLALAGAWYRGMSQYSFAQGRWGAE